ncbi:MAG: type II toxin-antitoxin system VapC family toxin [Candidatus Omnitrophica bacterium]|nr:type II toxin-antitoxin system VapC family toxin [Candidatus Omnitrophota bacterium]
MKTVFADTYYFLALLNPKDHSHQVAHTFNDSFDGKLLTTEWVLTEVADAMAGVPNRQKFSHLLDFLRSRPDVEIVQSNAQTFEQGVTLFRERPDKEWSLTDCISMSAMESRSIREVLTGDHLFEQSGYEVLL